MEKETPNDAHEVRNQQIKYLAGIVATHHLFPRVVEEVVACRKIGIVVPAEMTELDSLVTKVRHQRSFGNSHPSSGQGGGRARLDEELDDFMESYISTLTKSQDSLALGFQQADTAFASFLDKISLVQGRGMQAVAASADRGSGSSGGGTKKGGAASDGNDGLKGVLKKRFEGKLEILKSEFTKKRVKGKLPEEALQVLQAWWHANIKKPYPDEDEKRSMCAQSSLSMTQVNNFFINQRKRHWSKGDGSTTEETQYDAAAGDSGGTFAGVKEGHARLGQSVKREPEAEHKRQAAPKRRAAGKRSASDSEDYDSGTDTESD